MTNNYLVPAAFEALRNEDALTQSSVLANQQQLAPLPEKTHHYLQAAVSNNTRKAYLHDIRHFINWGGLLPASPEQVVRYLHDFAETLNVRTLSRRLTALKQWHLCQGFSDPTALQIVRKTMTGIKNLHGKPKDKAPALQMEQLVTIAKYLKGSPRLMDCRNNAIIQVAFFGAFRRSELVNIHYEHITFHPEGMEILVPRSKTDQGGEGQYCAIPFGDDILCPVTALTTWCEEAGISSGSVFRAINRVDNVGTKALNPSSINVIIKEIAAACNLPNACQYSSHSLRRGFATCASKKGAPFGAIMRQGRWQHEGTVLGYIEEGQRFEENAASIILDGT